MKRIADTDEIMAHFLGIESGKRRVKRFWQALLTVAAPYFFEPLGKALTSKIFGDMDQESLRMYDMQIAQLHNSQRELNYKIDQQATLFKIDSERKDFQIKWLARTQTEIKDKIKFLEGTFSKDSEEKAKEIQDLKNMLAETQKKIKMQEEIQNKLVNDVDQIKNQLKSVNEDINQISTVINNINNKLNVTTIIANLNSMSINFQFLLTEFESRQKELLGVIKNANGGKLDPYIITPLNLIQMLVEVQSMLPEETKFPFYPNIENAHKLYNLIKPTVYLYNNKILFMLRIALVNSKSFNLHKMTSVPVSVDDKKFAFIYPKRPYLLVDHKEREFTLLSSGDFQVYCQEIAKDIHICDQLRQLSPVVTSNSNCEIQLFLHSKEIPRSCQKRLVFLEKSIFLQLQNPNSWIYVVPDSENLIFNCAKERKSVEVRKSGFVHAGPGCSIRTPNLRLMPITEFTQTVFSTFFPTTDLRKFINMDYVKNLEMKDIEENKQVFSSIDFDELKDISWDLKAISTHSANSTNMLTMFLAVLLVGVIIVLILLVFKLYRIRRARRVI